MQLGVLAIASWFVWTSVAVAAHLTLGGDDGVKFVWISTFCAVGLVSTFCVAAKRVKP